ncbi:hypothetical protein KR009_005157 [Drosophila setifemur]|nr:hypothetical protein KR009_005157 [Drosophila setifemur]
MDNPIIKRESAKLRGMASPKKPKTKSTRRLFNDSMTSGDFLSILVILFLVGFFYVYGVFVVVPTILGTFGQVVNGILGTWIVYNILGNMWACNKIKSLVRSLPRELLQPRKGEEDLWHHCDTCKMMVPPRSWHCEPCNCCILKRDHHCKFTASCIGHNNHRYFLWFTFFLSFGTALLLVYNAIYTWNHGKWVFPEPMMLYDALLQDLIKTDEPGNSRKYLICAIFYANILSFLLPTFAFGSQVYMIHRNAVCYAKSDRTYDIGSKHNFEVVLGRRRFWTLLSPTIESPLPHDGVQWQSKQSV